jgi:glycosyltransferase involved in cell wall biosynthesis
MLDLSVVIPSHNDRYLYQTIQSILDNFETNFEVLVTLDGYLPPKPLKHPRVRYLHHPENRGMREAINTAVEAAQGRYLMRTDEHCMFGKACDRIVLEDIQDNWIMVPRRYFLDPVNWVLMDRAPVDYEKLVIKVNEERDVRKFSSCPWPNRDKSRKNILVDETMAFQGSAWFMARSWWDLVIGRLQSEGYGTLYQDTTEMQFKTWRAGGRIMLTKKTWYAHKHRNFNRTHNYPKELSRPSWEYALKVWGDDYEQVRKRWGV